MSTININENNNIIKVVQASDDVIRISETKITTDNTIRVVTADNIPGLSYISITQPPTSSSSDGTIGELRFNESFMFLCVSPNYWKKIPLTSF